MLTREREKGRKREREKNYGFYFEIPFRPVNTTPVNTTPVNTTPVTTQLRLDFCKGCCVMEDERVTKCVVA